MKKILALLLGIMMIIGCLPVSAFAAEDWESEFDPADPLPGSEEAPIDLTNDLLYEGDLSATVVVPAGETYYYIAYRVGGMVMSINGGEGVNCVTDGMFNPYSWNIANDAEEDAQYVITLAYPEGSVNNPADAYLGENLCSVAAGSEGYFLTYIADYTGDLIVTISGADQWTYVINNITTGVYGDTQWSDSDSVVNPATIAVAAGDEIQIIVNGYDPANPWEVPAAELAVYLVYAAGIEANPIFLDGDDTVTNTGTMYYQGRLGGQVVTITGEGEFSIVYNGQTINAVNGVIEFAPVGGGFFAPPVVFSLTGEGEFHIVANYPVGHSENPAVAVLGDNAASVEAGSQGYIMTYVAQEDGDLIVTISGADQWSYTINNMTSYVYGDTQWSDSDPVVNPATITVAAGDEIQIIVNGYDAANPWETPAAELTVNLAYAQTAPELPGATVTEIENDKLTFAMNFKADEATDEQLAYYANWYADFVLTVNKDVTFNANGGADGYLAGQYDEWSSSWVNVPGKDVTLAANSSLKIMEFAAELLGEPGLKYTYAEVYNSVKDFDCGVFFEDAFLQANPDLVVTLELRVYNPADVSENYAIGETYTFTLEEASGPIADENLKFYYIGLSFAEYIGIQPMLLNSAVAGYDSFYVEVAQLQEYGSEPFILEPTVSNNSYNVYDLQMLPRHMTEDVSLTIYAVKDGQLYYGETVVTSITALALDKIAEYQAENDLAACKVLVDLLVYGAEVQKAFNYKTTDVPTDYLGEYAALGTSGTPVIGGSVATEGSGIRVYANSLSLGSKVEVQFMFKTADVEGCKLVATFGNETIEVDASEFDTTVMDGYSVAIFALKPRNFRDTMTIAVYNIESGEAVSAIYTASVENYANGVLSKYPTLVPAMLNYGDSVLARFPG